MTQFIIPLEKVQHSDTAQVGGKAAVLGTLLQAGFPVPTGLCLTTAAFSLAFEPKLDQIKAIIHQYNLNQPAEAERAAQEIALYLADLTVPPGVMTALRQAWPATWDDQSPLVVRSSATAEDRAEASFSGQYTSVIGVQPFNHDDSAISEAILTGWRSFFSPNALAARAAHDALADHEAMALLIQPLIAADCAGVCYSVDPVHHRRDHVVINAAWGLGSGVVDGTVATDTAWVRRYGFKIDDRRVVTKTTQIVFQPDAGLQTAPVPEAQQTTACLPDPWLKCIAQFGLAVERLLGVPQDVEWAIAGEQVWLLQSRPLTALPPAVVQPSLPPVSRKDEIETGHLWTLVLFPEERDPKEVPLPLERDYLIVLESAREETCRFMGADRNQAVKFHLGRPYSRPLPLEITDGDRRVRRAARQDLQSRLQRQGLTAWDYWGPEVVSATERLRAFDLTTASGPALAEHLEDALAVRRRHYILHPMCGFEPSPSFHDLVAKISGLSDPDMEAMVYWLLEGEETPLSQLVDALYDLAESIRQRPALAVLIRVNPLDVMAQLMAHPQAALFRDKLAALFSIYGERTGDGYGSEATICTPTWREQPEQVLDLIKPYLDSGIEAPALTRQQAQAKREAQIDRFCAACDDQALVAEFRRQLAYYRKVRTVLEEHNHYIDQMALGQVRQAAMAAAKWLVGQRILTSQEDVFWLYFDEILAALRSDKPSTFSKTIAARQAQHAEWQALEPPPILGLPQVQLPERPPFQTEITPGPVTSPIDGSLTNLTGLGASPGRYSGRARVVANSVSLPDIARGDILVTENVGPRWTPLFPLLGGLILERGSLGQHAATTAREYNVPAVIHIAQATRLIPDGARITLDGTTGIVELDQG